MGFGLESAVPFILRNIGKVTSPNTKNDPNYNAELEFLHSVGSPVSESKKIGLKPFVSIMAGLPGETPSDLRETLKFVKELELPYYVHNYLQVFPGTPLYSDHQRFGINVKKVSIGSIHSTTHSYNTNSITPLKNSSIIRPNGMKRIC